MEPCSSQQSRPGGGNRSSGLIEPLLPTRGLAALQTYQICQQLVRGGKNAHLAAHLVEMKRLNKFGRSRRKAIPLPAVAQPPKA